MADIITQINFLQLESNSDFLSFSLKFHHLDPHQLIKLKSASMALLLWVLVNKSVITIISFKLMALEIRCFKSIHTNMIQSLKYDKFCRWSRSQTQDRPVSSQLLATESLSKNVGMFDRTLFILLFVMNIFQGVILFNSLAPKSLETRMAKNVGFRPEKKENKMNCFHLK